MRMSGKQQTVLRRSVALIMAIPALSWSTAYAQTAAETAAGAELEKQAVPDITALANLVPSSTLKSARGTNTTLTAFIRGIGQQDPVAGYEPGGGIYLDDVYMARPQGALTDIYGLERVETLRGPQSALYGKNTIGGAVKYVTRKLAPKMTFGVKATVGNDGEKDLVLSASVPLSEMLRIGGSVATFNRDGFGQNVINGLDNYNKNAVAGRISIELTPASDLFIRLSSDRTVDDSQAKQGDRLTPGPAPASLPAALRKASRTACSIRAWSWSLPAGRTRRHCSKSARASTRNKSPLLNWA